MPSSPLVLYVCYELILFLSSFALLSRFVWPSEPESAPGERSLSLLSLKMVLGCSIGMLLSFLGTNGALGFGVAAALLCGFLGYWFWWTRTVGRSPFPLFSGQALVSVKAVLIAAGIAALYLPALCGVMGPTSETDSLTSLNHLLKWLTQSSSPYDWFYNYVSFFEAGQLPAIVIGKSDVVFWIVSLQAVLIFAVAAYRLAREVELPHGLSLLLAVNCSAVFPFWGGLSGVGTIKNDMLYNAGLVLIICALFRIGRSRPEITNTLLLFCGITFASIKFSGPAIAVFALAAFGTLFALKNRPALDSLRAAAPLAIGLSILTCGHFYINNLIRYSNPVFPLKLRFLGLTLPGPFDLQGTSIAANWDKLEVWRQFLGSTREGLLFPVFFCLFLCLSPVLMSPRFAENRRSMLKALFLVIAACWLIYFSSIWTAGSVPGNLDIITAHGSFRYATAADLVSRLGALAVILICIPLSLRALFAVLALDTASRFRILYLEIVRIGAVPLVKPVAISLAALAVLTALLIYLKKPVFRYGFGFAGVIALMLSSPAFGEVNRGRWWLNEFKPVTDVLNHADPMRVFVLDEPTLWPLRYPASGTQFQHEITVGTERDLQLRLAGCAGAPEAIVLFGMGKPSPELMERVTAAAARCHMPLYARNDISALYYRSPEVELSSLAQRTAALVDGDIEHTALPAGTSLLFGTGNGPQRLWTRAAAGLKAVKGKPGDFVTLSNAGGFNPDGSYAGLRVEWTADGWSMNTPSLADATAKYTLSSLLVNGRPDPTWLLAGGGPITITPMEEEGLKFVRISASAQLPWLAAIFTARAKTARDSITWMGKLRVGGQAAASLTAYAGGKPIKSLRLPTSDKWLTVVDSQSISGSGTEFSYTVGLGSIPPNGYLDLTDVRVLSARMPSCVGEACR